MVNKNLIDTLVAALREYSIRFSDLYPTKEQTVNSMNRKRACQDVATAFAEDSRTRMKKRLWALQEPQATKYDSCAEYVAAHMVWANNEPRISYYSVDQTLQKLSTIEAVANVYPDDMTKEDFKALLVALQDRTNTSLRTVADRVNHIYSNKLTRSSTGVAHARI